MYDPHLQGHHSQRQRLQDRIASGKLSGALLFSGPDAIGKRRVALELAQRELCLRRDACGVCEGCRLFKGSELPTELPNLLRIAPEGKAGLIKIGMIRESDLVEGGVIAWAHKAPLPGTHRWVLVEDAHRLGGASANMLLKTLEEPPPDTHFLLITHRPEAMLQTIRSRSERIPFLPLGESEAWSVAASSGWGFEDRQRWSALAEGTLRYLDPADFARAVAQLESWMELAAGHPFAEAAGALLPEKDSPLAQSEQLARCLEMALRLLLDLARVQEERIPFLRPWEDRLRLLARTNRNLQAAQEGVHRALANLRRNPSAESLLREVAFGL